MLNPVLTGIIQSVVPTCFNEEYPQKLDTTFGVRFKTGRGFFCFQQSYLVYGVSVSTVRNVFNAHGILPDLECVNAHLQFLYRLLIVYSKLFAKNGMNWI